MTRLNTFLAVCFLVMLPAARAGATSITFSGTLHGSNENPPNGSPGTGAITAVLDDVADTLEVTESFVDLTAPDSAAHIHCCAAPGTNAPVVLNFVGTGFPIGVTAGTYHHIFDLTTSLSGISVSTFISNLEGGLAYANIHDANFPGGEIRAQLLPAVVATPEPGSLFLCATGLLAAARSLRRRRR